MASVTLPESIPETESKDVRALTTGSITKSPVVCQEGGCLFLTGLFLGAGVGGGAGEGSRGGGGGSGGVNSWSYSGVCGVGGGVRVLCSGKAVTITYSSSFSLSEST